MMIIHHIIGFTSFGFIGVGAVPIIRDGQSAAGIHQAPPTGSGLECRGKAGTKQMQKAQKEPD